MVTIYVSSEISPTLSIFYRQLVLSFICDGSFCTIGLRYWSTNAVGLETEDVTGRPGMLSFCIFWIM